MEVARLRRLVERDGLGRSRPARKQRRSDGGGASRGGRLVVVVDRVKQRPLAALAFGHQSCGALILAPPRHVCEMSRLKKVTEKAPYSLRAARPCPLTAGPQL